MCIYYTTYGQRWKLVHTRTYVVHAYNINACAREPLLRLIDHTSLRRYMVGGFYQKLFDKGIYDWWVHHRWGPWSSATIALYIYAYIICTTWVLSDSMVQKAKGFLHISNSPQIEGWWYSTLRYHSSTLLFWKVSITSLKIAIHIRRTTNGFDKSNTEQILHIDKCII